MDWNTEDSDFTSKTKAPKKGRRAGLLAPQSPERDSSSTFPDSLLDSPKSTTDESLQIPPKARKAGGWADESVKTSKKSTTNLIEQERFRTLNSEGSDDDIPIIPDLDDLQEDMMSMGIANAPSIAVNRVAAYKELNFDLLQQGAFACLDGIDLSLLAKNLQEESELVEPDEPWPWDQLFTEVVGSIYKREEVSTVPL